MYNFIHDHLKTLLLFILVIFAILNWNEHHPTPIEETTILESTSPFFEQDNTTFKPFSDYKDFMIYGS
jgi:hypothetical protein